MKIRLWKLVAVVIFCLVAELFVVSKAQAATLGIISDRISTSRPSASSVLFVNQAASTNSAVLVDNGSMFLASDSATFRPDTGETQDIVTVASMSASFSSGPPKRVVHFTGLVSNAHHQGDPVVVPITAVHTISFQTVNAIPVNGEISIIFPALTTGDANFAASPSATTFQMNSIASGQVMLVDNGTTYGGTYSVSVTNPSNGTSPAIRLTTLNTQIQANRTVTILLGCSAQTNGVCTTEVPRIINPTKTAGTGSADTWRLRINTRDIANNLELDAGIAMIGTVESVEVRASVDPSLTITISGVAGGANLNTLNSSCASETTTTSIGTTANLVDLGVLSTSITLAAQQISVTTNVATGYTITATSSGTLIDPQSGFFIPNVNLGVLTANDTPAPAAMTAGTPAFGIFPCGARPPTSSPDWDDELTIAASAKGSNPWNTMGGYYYATVARYTGPVGVSSDLTTIRYAATVASTTPAGLYRNVFTYVITPTF